jgi:hypothetical protein
MLIKVSHGRLLVGYRKSDWQEIFYEPESSHITATHGVTPPAPMFCYSATADLEANKNPYAEEINWLPQYDPTNFEAQAKAQKIMQYFFLFRCWQYMEGATAQQLAQNQFDRPNYVRWQTWKKAADAKKKRTKSGKPQGEKRSAEGQSLVMLSLSSTWIPMLMRKHSQTLMTKTTTMISMISPRFHPLATIAQR